MYKNKVGGQKPISDRSKNCSALTLIFQKSCKLVTFLLWSFVVPKNNIVVESRCASFVTEGFDVCAEGRLVPAFEMWEAVLDAPLRWI